MFLRFRDSMAGHSFSYQPGDVIDWPDENEAQRMVARDVAEELDPDKAAQIAEALGTKIRKHVVREKAIATGDR